MGILQEIYDDLFGNDFKNIIEMHEKRMRNNKKIHDNIMSKHPKPMDELELEE